MNYKELFNMSKIEYKGVIIKKDWDDRQVHYYQVTINNEIFDYLWEYHTLQIVATYQRF